MIYTLYGRLPGAVLRYDSPHPTYGTAVVAGQQRFGYGNFLVSSDHVPTREEQFLIQTEKDKIQTILNSI